MLSREFCSLFHDILSFSDACSHQAMPQLHTCMLLADLTTTMNHLLSRSNTHQKFSSCSYRACKWKWMYLFKVSF